MSTILQLRSPFENPFGPRTGAMQYQQPGSPRSTHSEQPSTTSPSASMGPPSTNSPEVEQHGNGSTNNNSSQTGAAAVGASSGPKVVQTAFIHKLYSMLEDKSIQRLISWSNNGESFVMSPSNEFSKVLAQYFKHTNISSFVRQLNMYGFHKVSDVFHTTSTDSAMWEFRHGNGNFKKGDLHGLREIKRRASRHTLIHRDSFTNNKPGPAQPGTPAEVNLDPEARLRNLESIIYDMNDRLTRMDDNYSLMSSRCQSLAESLGRCHGWISHLSSAVQHSTGPETALHSDMLNMQKEISRQQELVRSLEQPLEVGMNGGRSHYTGSAMALDGPVSPRGYAFSDSRRSSIQMQEPPPAFGARPPVPPLPPQFNAAPSPRRFGSIGGTQTSPGFSKPPLPPPSQPHPLSNVVSPPLNLARRHTSADIREHGWPLPNGPNGSPYASGQNSVQWQPSSPQQQPQDTGDQQLQNQLANYQINGSRRPTITAADQDMVPPAHLEPPPSNFGTVAWGIGHSKFPRPNSELHSAPATRRSSQASNVHSLLNPADTVEQENEDEGGYDDRKRKRMA